MKGFPICLKLLPAVLVHRASFDLEDTDQSPGMANFDLIDLGRNAVLLLGIKRQMR